MSCGIDHEIKGLEDTKIDIGPDYEGMARFCDNRYGFKTEEAEACFYDLRTYYNIEFSFNFDLAVKFCKNNPDCVADLIEWFNNYDNET